LGLRSEGGRGLAELLAGTAWAFTSWVWFRLETKLGSEVPKLSLEMLRDPR
jgi:hypothetical protein